MTSMIYVPPTADTVLPVPLTGYFGSMLVANPFDDNTSRVGSVLVPRGGTFIGAAIQALVQGASSLCEIDVLDMSLIDGAYDPDPGNDVSLYPTGPRPTIGAGKNFGVYAPAPVGVLVEAGQVLTINCTTAGHIPAEDPGDEYVVIFPANTPSATYFTFNGMIAGPGSAGSPIVMGTVGAPMNLTLDAAGATTIQNKLIAGGYTLPNPVTFGLPPDGPEGSPPATDTFGATDAGHAFYWKVAAGAAVNTGSVTGHGGYGYYHPIVPAGASADGVTALLFFE